MTREEQIIAWMREQENQRFFNDIAAKYSPKVVDAAINKALEGSFIQPLHYENFRNALQSSLEAAQIDPIERTHHDMHKSQFMQSGMAEHQAEIAAKFIASPEAKGKSYSPEEVINAVKGGGSDLDTEAKLREKLEQERVRKQAEEAEKLSKSKDNSVAEEVAAAVSAAKIRPSPPMG